MYSKQKPEETIQSTMTYLFLFVPPQIGSVLFGLILLFPFFFFVRVSGLAQQCESIIFSSEHLTRPALWRPSVGSGVLLCLVVKYLNCFDIFCPIRSSAFPNYKRLTTLPYSFRREPDVSRFLKYYSFMNAPRKNWRWEGWLARWNPI